MNLLAQRKNLAAPPWLYLLALRMKNLLLQYRGLLSQQRQRSLLSQSMRHFGSGS